MGLETIRAADAYARGVDGTGIVIGVVDSGIFAAHPEFAGRYGGSYDYLTETAEAVDRDGHGTNVASVIAANRAGRHRPRAGNAGPGKGTTMKVIPAPPDSKTRLRAALVELLYRQSRAILLANLLIPWPVAYVPRETVPAGQLLGWIGAIYLLTAARLLLSRRYFARTDGEAEAPKWA